MSWALVLLQGVFTTCGPGLGLPLLLPRRRQELEAFGDVLVFGLWKLSLGRSMDLGSTLAVLLLLMMALRLSVSCP